MYKKSSLVPGAERLCSALLELDRFGDDPLIKKAESAIGSGYSPAGEANRQKLVRMVKLNLINRKKYPREVLNLRFSMQISKDELTREKKRFCRALLKECRLYNFS